MYKNKNYNNKKISIKNKYHVKVFKILQKKVIKAIVTKKREKQKLLHKFRKNL